MSLAFSIHQAAQEGNLQKFEELAFSTDPFMFDEKGFTPLHIAEQNHHDGIVNWYKTHYPANFTTFSFENNDIPLLTDNNIIFQSNLKNFFKLDTLLNKSLRLCGLRKLAVNLSAPPTTEVEVTIPQLLSSFLAGIHQPSDAKPTDSVVLDETKLSQVVFGMIEEIEPFSFLTLLTKKFNDLNQQQKILCLYMIKELIKQDADNEFLTEVNFAQTLTTFFKTATVSEALQSLDIIAQLQKYYELKCTFTFKKMPNFPEDIVNFSAYPQKKQTELKDFLQDLDNILCEVTLNLTSLNFDGKQLTADNPDWTKLCKTMDQISQMVCLDILSANNKKDRNRLTKFYLTCIDNCLAGANLAAALALHNGLHFNVIKKLKYTSNSHHENTFDTTDNFKNLRERMTSTPTAIPYMGIYSGLKDRAKEYPITNRILKYGEANFNFFKTRFYLAQRSISPFKTDLREKLATLKYDENKAYHDLYAIKPPKVICLTEILSFHDLIKKLNFCQEITAPLACKTNESSKIRLEDKAMSAIIKYAQKKFSKTWTSEEEAQLHQLCNTIINNFNPKRASNVVEELASSLSELELDLNFPEKKAKSVSLKRAKKHHSKNHSLNYSPVIPGQEIKKSGSMHNLQDLLLSTPPKKRSPFFKRLPTLPSQPSDSTLPILNFSPQNPLLFTTGHRSQPNTSKNSPLFPRPSRSLFPSRTEPNSPFPSPLPSTDSENTDELPFVNDPYKTFALARTVILPRREENIYIEDESTEEEPIVTPKKTKKKKK